MWEIMGVHFELRHGDANASGVPVVLNKTQISMKLGLVLESLMYVLSVNLQEGQEVKT